MTISMYKASVPVFVQFLTSLSAVLDKAAAYAEAKKVEPSVLLNTRLAPDMFPLVRQVRAATDHAINACARLAGADMPSFSNTETTIPELKDRIAKTHRFPQELQARADRRQRGQGDQDYVPERGDARVHRPVAAAHQLTAKLLFPLHHRLRPSAPLRDRARQARFHGHAGLALTSRTGCSETLAPRSGERVARAQRGPGNANPSACRWCALLPLTRLAASRFGTLSPLRGSGCARRNCPL